LASEPIPLDWLFLSKATPNQFVWAGWTNFHFLAIKSIPLDRLDEFSFSGDQFVWTGWTNFRFLVMNGLHDRVVLHVDGGFRTAFDVVVGALLGWPRSLDSGPSRWSPLGAS